MKINKIDFKFVQVLKPYLDEQNKIIESRPQSRYEKRNKLPLHKYGKGSFCKFKIERKHYGKRGIYAILVKKKILYIGECEDLFDRFNAGYGNISPRNCFEGGRETNCRINNLILKLFKKGLEIDLYFYETKKNKSIEKMLIKENKPEWNRTNKK